MKAQNNLKLFQVILNKTIYKLIIFGIAYHIPIVYAYAAYDDCEAVKAPYIEDDRCKIEVTNCKEDSVAIAVPEGSKIVATCNVFRYDNCATADPRPPNCEVPRCPTNPNECANDDESDGVANYTNTAPPGLASNDNETQEDENDNSNEEEVHSCEKEGRTRVENYTCKMQVTGCKQGDEDAIPQGATATAVCDTGRCNRKLIPDCHCPTDPNECANDTRGDSSINYTNTEPITSSDEPEAPRSSPRRRSRGVN